MKRLSTAEVNQLAKAVVHYFENAGNQDTSLTCRHFTEQGANSKTVRRIIQRYLQEGRITHKPRGGKFATVSSRKVVQKVQKIFENNPRLSVRNAAQQVGIAKSTLSDIKVQSLGIVARKRKTAPKYSGDQAKRAKSGCRKIYRMQLLSGGQKVLLIDDETYCPADPDQIPGVEYYHGRVGEEVANEIKYKGKAKFAKKFLVWQCLDENGNVSDPYISTGTMNAETYLTECLQKRLLPFIDQHHEREDVLLWMDMATCHYARDVTRWLEENNIEYVKRDDNAPNVPQARPIEKFWSLCKAEYKRRKTGAKNLNSFKRIWRKISKKVAQKSGTELMQRVRGKIRGIAYNGVYAPLR
jgi:transposase